jgi:predicted deacylase
MKDNLQVGKLLAPENSRVAGKVQLDLQVAEVELPIFLVNGRQQGPTLVVTAGVHGAEYAGIAAALQVGRELLADELRGQVIVVPVVNTAAFWSRLVYVSPLDGKNLNRVFPGSREGTPSEVLAHWVFEHVIRQADYYIDLHGGDLIEALNPYTNYYRTGTEEVTKNSLQLARVFGIPMIKGSDMKGSACASAAEAGIPSILAESGGQGIWTAQDVARHVNGIGRLMLHLQMLEGGEPDPVPITVLSQSTTLRSGCDGFWYPAAKVGDIVSRGEHLGQVTDFAGNVLQLVTSPMDGSVLYVVSSLAIHRAEPLVSVGC